MSIAEKGFDWQPTIDVLPVKLGKQLTEYVPESRLGISLVPVLKALPAEYADLGLEVLDALAEITVMHTSLYGKVLRSPDSRFYAGELVEDYGLLSRKVVTTAGVNWLADAWQGTVEPEDMRYHGIGTGTTAAVIGDTDIETELTTEYPTNNTRATGSLTEGASANIFRSVATNTLDSGTPAITEHGLLNNATVGSGVLWDRHVFAAINLDGTVGDGLQTTYDLTFSSGG